MDLSIEDQIWNRAAMQRGGNSPRVGDLNLASLLHLYSITMNGGLEHAVEFLGASKFADGIQGFRYFGLLDAAVLLERALQMTGEDLELLDEEFGALISSDTTLTDAFKAKYQSSPDLFSPI
jgi:hypothetical protein